MRIIKAKKLKVKLLSYTKNPQGVVAAAIRQCYSPDSAGKIMKKLSLLERERLIKMVISSGHISTLEHAAFTFGVEGISRACSHQLVRHRLASYSQQSQRYVDLSKEGLSYILPPAISQDKILKREFQETMVELAANYAQLIKRGMNPEDARFVLPNACETKIVVTMNARELLHFFQLRTCRRAQWEIRALAKAMLQLVRKVAPALFAKAGPTCETEKICWEGRFSCGRWKEIPGAELRER
jgi:thymidylate synthase (FAD)